MFCRERERKKMTENNYFESLKHNHDLWRLESVNEKQQLLERIKLLMKNQQLFKTFNFLDVLFNVLLGKLIETIKSVNL